MSNKRNTTAVRNSFPAGLVEPPEASRLRPSGRLGAFLLLEEEYDCDLEEQMRLEDLDNRISEDHLKMGS